MEQQMSESIEPAANVAVAKSDKTETKENSADLVERMREFARRVVDGEPTADIFGVGQGFLDGVVVQAYKFYGAKSYDKAQTLLKGVIALDNTRAYPHLLLGDIMLQKTDYEEAMQQFERAYELDPKDGEILAKLGEAKLRAGFPEEATGFLVSAMEVLESESRHYKRSTVLRKIAQSRGLETEATGPA